jgi:nicotinamidase-related amidase
MPLSQLDAVSALVVIDLQKGIVAMNTAQPVGEVITHARELARSFRRRGLPVVLVNVAGRSSGRTDAGAPTTTFPAGWLELVPELEPQPTDILITKHRVGAFIGTQLDEILRERGVTQIFLAGVSTSIGVESTARAAYDHGYNVVLVVDAMTDRDASSHRHSVEKIFPRIGESTTTAEVIARLS